MERRLGEYLDKVIRIHRPGEGPKPSKPLELPPSSTPVIKKDTPVEHEEEEEKEEEEEEEEAGEDAGSLAAALRKKKQGLKPTETVERHNPVIGVGGGERGGDGLTNIKSDAEKREFFDSPQDLQRKVQQVAKWMRESKHTIFFTGAGISTRFVAVNR